MNARTIKKQTLGLLQINEFEVVPTPASKVMLQSKYGIYEGLQALRVSTHLRR
jgi:hypothetical protein